MATSESSVYGLLDADDSSAPKIQHEKKKHLCSLLMQVILFTLGIYSIVSVSLIGTAGVVPGIYCLLYIGYMVECYRSETRKCLSSTLTLQTLAPLVQRMKAIDYRMYFTSESWDIFQHERTIETRWSDGSITTQTVKSEEKKVTDTGHCSVNDSYESPPLPRDIMNYELVKVHFKYFRRGVDASSRASVDLYKAQFDTFHNRDIGKPPSSFLCTEHGSCKGYQTSHYASKVRIIFILVINIILVNNIITILLLYCCYIFLLSFLLSLLFSESIISIAFPFS